MRFERNPVDWFRIPAMDGHSPRVFTGDLGIRYTQDQIRDNTVLKKHQLTGK